jgi:hypothetical protein
LERPTKNPGGRPIIMTGEEKILQLAKQLHKSQEHKETELQWL